MPDDLRLFFILTARLAELQYALLHNENVKEKTNMKFRMISAADVDVIRKARRALRRLQKRLGKLDVKRTDALRDTRKNYVSAAMDCSRMLDEIMALHVFVYANGDLSIEA